MNPIGHYDAKLKILEGRLQAGEDQANHQLSSGLSFERAVRDFLNEYVPSKFGVESNCFVRSLENPSWISPEIDVLFTRADIGMPIAESERFRVFPIEAVVGFLQVTKNLTRRKLDDDFAKVLPLKARTKRTYIITVALARSMGIIKGPPKPEDMIRRQTFTIDELQPRFYYFAGHTAMARDKTICAALYRASRETGSHCHGLFILDRGFFFIRPRATEQDPWVIQYITDRSKAFVYFLHCLLESLQSFTALPYSVAIPFGRYSMSEVSLGSWVPS